MKTMTLANKVGLTFALWMGNVVSAWAAGTREDNSDLFVWIFLAFCALIVVAQLIPAMLLLLGVAKGVKKTAPQTVPETVDPLPTSDKSDA